MYIYTYMYDDLVVPVDTVLGLIDTGTVTRKNYDGSKVHEKVLTEASSMVKFSSWVFRVFIMTIVNKNDKNN